jgi:hypothetical protein
MPEPKYLDSLRDEIAVLDHKIDGFNEKVDQKVDSLNEYLHGVEIALTALSARLDAFVQRVDKNGYRQWQFFLAVLGLTATFLAVSAASFWQVQQHGKQLEKLEKSVEKIGGLESSITRLDHSLERYGQQLEKVAKVAALEAKLGDLPKVARSMEEFLKESRELLLASEIRRLKLPLR